MHPEDEKEKGKNRNLKPTLTNFTGSILDKIPDSWGMVSLKNPIINALLTTGLFMGITAVNTDSHQEYTQALRVTALFWPFVKTIIDRTITRRLINTETSPFSHSLATSAMTLFVSLIQ